jgi:Putative transposase
MHEFSRSAMRSVSPANVWVGPNDRARQEQLCRYVLRLPPADDRLRRVAGGRVRLGLRRARSDGTMHLPVEPVEFLEKLAALTLRPPLRRHESSSQHSRHDPIRGAAGPSIGDVCPALASPPQRPVRLLPAAARLTLHGRSDRIRPRGQRGHSRGVRGAGALAAAVTQTLVAEGPTVIEAVVDSNHSVDTVYD